MNILFFNDCLGAGGGEIWVLQAAQKLQERGHRVYIGCPTGAWLQRQAEKFGIGSFTYLPTESFVPNLIWTLREFVQEEEIDVIFCTLLGYRNEAKILTHALREAGRGIIILKMGLPPWRGLTAEHLGYGLEDCVKKITVVAHDIKASIQETIKEIHSDRIWVCYEGVDLSPYDPDKYRNQNHRELVKSEYGIGVDSVLLATIARLDPSKGHQYLLRTAAQVLKKHPNITFIIAGDGSEMVPLKKMACSLGISERIVFTGFVDDVAHLLSAVDLLVHPSLAEGLSNSVMEAMAMAKPIVATDVGGMSELIIHGETGLMVPPGSTQCLIEATLELLGDKNRMYAMGTAGRKRVETYFDKDIQVRNLEDFLQEEVDKALRMKRRPRAISLNEAGLPTEVPDFIFRRSWPRF